MLFEFPLPFAPSFYELDFSEIPVSYTHLDVYKRQLIGLGIPQGVVPTLANILNILVQVVISYPTMKFWVMPGKRKAK